MAIHGHHKILDSLHIYLPQVSLFIGPYSVGRWTMAEHLRWFWNIDTDDLLRIHTLDVEAAQTIREFSSTSPTVSDFKLVVVELYRASPAAQISLIDVLENPGKTRFIIIAQENEVIHGVRSRGVPFRFHYLNPEEVAIVLQEKVGFSQERALELGRRANGHIAEALKLADSEEVLIVVRSMIKALRTNDIGSLTELAATWTDEATSYLTQWCNEAISRQWRVFDPEDFIEGPSLPLRILVATRPRVRPRLVVRSQLMSILKES